MQRIVLACGFASLLGCAHPAAPTCPRMDAQTCASEPPRIPEALGFADPESLNESEPLALYDVRWMVLAGESGVLTEVPPALHSFTLGRWECALSAEDANDQFVNGHAQVARTRRIACTHATGLTMQSEVRCGYQIPGPVSEGSPRHARRESHIALADAPPLTLACEPFVTERLELVHGAREPVAQVCLHAGELVPCKS
jgi:hypothetical protein